MSGPRSNNRKRGKFLSLGVGLSKRKQKEHETFLLGRLFRPSRDPLKKQKEVGRNDPCPCGSGKKYKYCCGRK